MYGLYEIVNHSVQGQSTITKTLIDADSELNVLVNRANAWFDKSENVKHGTKIMFTYGVNLPSLTWTYNGVYGANNTTYSIEGHYVIEVLPMLGK